MRRTLLVLAITVALTACGDDTDDTGAVAQPDSIAVDLSITVHQTEDREWAWEFHGWWDGEIGAGVLTEGDEPVWFEDGGSVTRLGVIVPDLTTPWVVFDLDAWSAVGVDDRDFLEVGPLVEVWAVPSIRTLVGLRDLVAAQEPGEGTTTVRLDGTAFLDAIDRFVAHRSLVACGSAVEMDATVDAGVVTALEFDLDTGLHLRRVRVDFDQWSGELPTPPDESEVTTMRGPRNGDGAAAGSASDCGATPHNPVVLDRSACEGVGRSEIGDWFAMVERHGAATPARTARISLSLARVVGLDELRTLLATHDLEVVRLAVQAPTTDRGVMNLHGLVVDAVPDDQVQLESMVVEESGTTIVAGATVVSEIEVEGTWADIATLASDCVIHDAGSGNGLPRQVDLTPG